MSNKDRAPLLILASKEITIFYVLLLYLPGLTIPVFLVVGSIDRLHTTDIPHLASVVVITFDTHSV